MRLCLLANAASIHTRRWAMHFAATGHEVAVISLTAGQIPGVTVRTVSQDPALAGRFAYLLAVPQVRRILREVKPDLVHGHYVGGYGVLAALSGYRPLVLSAWGSDVLVVPRTNRALKWAIRRSLRRADLITSVADHMTASIRSLGVAGEVITVPFGVDLSVFKPERREAWNGGSSQLIVSTRNLEPVYNVDLLIEALPEIFEALPEVRAEIIGDGSMRSGLEGRARELGIGGRIAFLGKLPQPEIVERLSRADVFVSTSLSDGNNISLNEAMACGVFPVVTDIPANRQWIEQGRNGFLVDARNPSALAGRVILGFRSPELRLAAAGRNWRIVQERGSWKTSMAVMEAKYHELIGRNRGDACAAHKRERGVGEDAAAGLRRRPQLYSVYRFRGLAEGKPEPPAGYDVFLWRPGPLTVRPPTLPIRFAAWWLFHQIGVFRGPEYCVLLMVRNGRVVHRSCLVPKYFRWPYMEDGDLQISSTWTDPQCCGKGLATYGLQYLLAAYGGPNRTFWYMTREENVPSIAVCRKAHFQFVTYARRAARFGSLLLGMFKAIARQTAAGAL